MTKELFEKAKFGDRFVTRGGKEALFLRLTENSEWQFADFYVKDWGQIRVNRENGKCLNGPDIENDIVGMMPSLPSALDEAAEEYRDTEVCTDSDYIDDDGDSLYRSFALREAFKAGAEWMAGQGITFEGKASRRYENGLAGFVSWILFDQQKAAHLLVNQGEEADVIINIRKK